MKSLLVLLRKLISNELRDKLKSVFSSLPSPYLEREKHLLLSYQKTVSILPHKMLSLIREFKANPNISPVLLFRNLPVDDDLPSTPFDGKLKICKKSFISEACLTGFSQIIGDLYGYNDEKEGELIQNVFPIKGREKSNSGEGSNVRFYFHFDNAYFRLRPDYLSLYCLRSDHDKVAITSVMDVRDLVKQFSKEEMEILRKPLFSTPAPDSFREAHGEILWSEFRPILSGPISAPELVLKLPEMKTNSLDAEYVFSKVKKKILNDEVPSCGIKLETGDFLIINNHRAMHSRSKFAPRYDGKDR
jgi:L-asparagine oxygenase